MKGNNKIHTELDRVTDFGWQKQPQTDVAPLVLNANGLELNIRMYVDKQRFELETNRSRDFSQVG